MSLCDKCVKQRRAANCKKCAQKYEKDFWTLEESTAELLKEHLKAERTIWNVENVLKQGKSDNNKIILLEAIIEAHNKNDITT